MAQIILVSNLDSITSEEDLQALFGEFGEVESLTLNDEPDPEKDTYSAQVIMTFRDEAEAAVEELNGEQIDGNWLYVRFTEQDKRKEKSVLDEIETEKLEGDSFEVIQKKRRRE